MTRLSKHSLVQHNVLETIACLTNLLDDWRDDKPESCLTLFNRQQFGDNQLPLLSLLALTRSHSSPFHSSRLENTRVHGPHIFHDRSEVHLGEDLCF